MSIKTTQNDVPRHASVALKLLNDFDCDGVGYPDKFASLREIYGPTSDGELLRLFPEQFAEEGLL